MRRLQPWARKSSKRLVKAPRVYVRDSGLVHALLGLTTQRELLSHRRRSRNCPAARLDARIAGTATRNAQLMYSDTTFHLPSTI
ncbi:MAG: DUF4143 domain-containing protein [Burkholderiales bacterium]|nr:DUF4143 domain-containing protein [Burkholderiales bacterium]